VTIEPLVIRGRIVTFDKRSRVIDDGASMSAPTSASPRSGSGPDDPDYKPSISLPANAYCQLAGEATLKYVETKAVIGGTTAIQGSAKVPHYDGWLVRNVEKETFKKTKKVSIRQSVRELKKKADFDKYRKAMDDGYSFIYHLAEGSDPSLIDEFRATKKNELLHKRLLAIHSSALTETEFKKWTPKGSIVRLEPPSAQAERQRDVEGHGNAEEHAVEAVEHPAVGPEEAAGVLYVQVALEQRLEQVAQRSGNGHQHAENQGIAVAQPVLVEPGTPERGRTTDHARDQPLERLVGREVGSQRPATVQAAAEVGE